MHLFSTSADIHNIHLCKEMDDILTTLKSQINFHSFCWPCKHRDENILIGNFMLWQTWYRTDPYRPNIPRANKAIIPAGMIWQVFRWYLFSSIKIWYLSTFSRSGPHDPSQEGGHSSSHSGAARIDRGLASIKSYKIIHCSGVSRGKPQPWPVLQTPARPSVRALTSSWHSPWLHQLPPPHQRHSLDSL